MVSTTPTVPADDAAGGDDASPPAPPFTRDSPAATAWSSPCCWAYRCCWTWRSSGSRRSASVFLSFTKWTGVGGVHLKACSTARHAARHPATRLPLRRAELPPGVRPIYPDFWPAVRHNAASGWLVFIVIATPLGMLFAVIIDRGIRGSRIYQSILFLPVMLSLALIGIIWELIYSPNYGLINTVIGRNGNSNLIDWLGNPHLNLWAVLVEATWRQAGYVMVLYLAGLKAVDPALREAGADRRRQRLADVLARGVPGDAADQHRDPGGHRDRVAARVRPGLHHQQGQPVEGPRTAVGARSPRTSSARPSGSASARRSAWCCS